MTATYDEDSITTEIGTFTWKGVDFAIECETFPSLDAPHEHSKEDADFHALFDDTKGDIADFFRDGDFLQALEAWIRTTMGLPLLQLGFQESGAQSSDMVALQGVA
jgi:hypothetical protein